VPTARPRTARTTRFGIGCILAYGLLGWVLSGIGAVLPRLRDAVGSSADVLALAPGALLVSPALVGGLRLLADVGRAFWCVPVLLGVVWALDRMTVDAERH